MSGITINEDSTHFFCNRPPDDMTEEGVDGFLDTYANTHVREIMFNVNARYTSYPSTVWEKLWLGYDPDGNHGPELATRFEGHVPPNRLHLLHNLYLLEQRGIDPYERWLRRSREVGISPWISIRMNDLHHLQMSITERRELLAAADPPQHRARYREVMNVEDGAPDYAVPEVYDHFMALVREVAERYDMDGLEMDFTRHFHFFQPHRGIADQPVMTRFVREARAVLERHGEARGRETRLCVKVPGEERTARWLGMDVITWAREGLVDYVVPTPRWQSIDFGIAVDEWNRLLEGTGVLLGPALEPRVKPYLRYPLPKEMRGQGFVVSPELVRGAAATYLNQGADRVYLMNYFDDRADLNGRVLLKECGLLNDVGSLEAMSGKTRRHMVTFPDMTAPGQPSGEVLPLVPYIDYEGDPYFGQLRINTGPKPGTEHATVVLEFGEETDGPPADFELYVNGHRATHSGPYETELPRPLRGGHGFTLDPDALYGSDNVLELMSDQPWSVHWVEIVLS